MDNMWDYMFLLGARPMMLSVIVEFFKSAQELLLSAESEDSCVEYDLRTLLSPPMSHSFDRSSLKVM